MLRPGRKVTGMSAILLPFTAGGRVDWGEFESHVGRTLKAGLAPAVNMDTGYANLIDAETRAEALRRTSQICGGKRFVAGVFVKDDPGADFSQAEYQRGIDEIQLVGGTPILFQSFGLTSGEDEQILERYKRLSACCDEFLGFELGQMFAPFGKIYSLDLYRELIQLPNCIGAKHSSLRRDLEWDRIVVRDAIRPEFMVLTGNDLAIDMVMYGSDYLLGLSTFAPEAFARRDAMWEHGDENFYQLNDLLQYLGTFAFRDPVPAYKHSAAMFLQLRGWIKSCLTHPESPTRPESDRDVLRLIQVQLDAFSESH
ncbi:MAG: dihydrodipicolinate synthase family protein [Planctomycetota bacterium]